MKQKQVKAAPKSAKQTNAKKATPSKKVVAAAVEEVEEEAVEEKVLPTKKPANKKATKVQKKKVVEEVIESPEEEEEDDEVEQDSEEEDDDEEPMDEEVADDETDEEQEDDEQEDEEEDTEEEGDEEEDDEEENDGEEDDDEAPTEAPIDEEPTMPSKVKSGEIPPSVPIEKIIHIKKLPAKCKKIDIVQAFAQYGAIDQVHIVAPSGTVANVAFKTAKAAQKAVLAANKKVKIHNSIIEVALKKPRKEKKTEETKPKQPKQAKEPKEAKEWFNYNECRDRSVCVKFLQTDTTEDQVKEHFAACGEIENVKVVVNKNNSVANAYVTFTDKKALPAAKKLHHTVLNKAKIGVFDNTLIGQRDPKLSIILKNKQELESIDGEKVEKIFAKCGEIVNMDVMRSKNILAIISFKDEEATQKAFKMNGKTEQGIELEIAEYNPHQKKTSIYVSNLPRDCTEEDLTDIFSKAGEISSVFLKPSFAVITFKDTDGFCKSFLFNETKIRNKFIFVQPNSLHKKNRNKSKPSKFNNFNNKRPAQNGNSFVFKPKKPKLH